MKTRTAAELAFQIGRPNPQDVNSGLTSPSQQFMLDVFGKPGKLTTECSEPLPEFARQCGSEVMGPFVCKGHKVALKSLQNVFADIRNVGRFDLIANVKCNGMLCVRRIRGGKGFSNHSFGTAIDLYFGGNPDAEQMGDGLIQQGLLDIYPFFHARSWYWGGGYQREDAMHFEASTELIRDWQDLGLI